MAKAWKCTDCGHVVVADERPSFAWDDGHVCQFEEYRKYFKFDDLVQVPKMEGTIFYHGREEHTDEE